MKATMKKVLSMMLVVALTVGITISGTLAYLTDRDSEANVFTVGDVSIDLTEDFQQGSTLIPGVDIEKKAIITNTGKNDAWVWLTVLLPEEMGPYTAPDNMSASNNVVHWNYPAESAANITVDFNGTPVEVDTDGDGETESYYQTNMLWKNVLEAGDTTGIMLSKVYMDTRVDIDPDGNMYWVVDGVATDLGWNVNEKGNPVIHVSAYGIQTEGFATVEEAYEAYQTQWGDNGAEYAPADSDTSAPSVEVPENAQPVSAAEDLSNALTAGGDYVIDAPITVSENLSVAANTNLYCTDANNVVSFENNSKITVNTDMSLALYGVQMDGNGTYGFSSDGSIVYDDDARRTTPLLNVGEGATLTLGSQTNIENVVAKGSAVIFAKGTETKRAKVVLEHASITNCAGESGTIINVDKAGDVVIGEGTVISNNASYNNNNHGIIRVYNAWDAENPSTVTMNGGEISNNYYSGNGLIGLYYGKMIMNGGEICNNSWFEDNQKSNGFYPVVYVHSNSQFVMNGGEISGNSVRFGVLNCLNSAVEPAIIINGGIVVNNTNTDNNADAFVAALIEDEGKILESVSVSTDATVSGMVWDYYTGYYTLEQYFAKVSD